MRQKIEEAVLTAYETELKATASKRGDGAHSPSKLPVTSPNDELGAPDADEAANYPSQAAG